MPTLSEALSRLLLRVVLAALCSQAKCKAFHKAVSITKMGRVTVRLAALYLTITLT